MPVHTPGPRLFSSIPFRHLAKNGSAGKASNIHLNLTPFVDMMTILVTFLLMLFGTPGRVTPKPDLDMVKGISERDLIQTEVPAVIITKNSVNIGTTDYAYSALENGSGIHPQMKNQLAKMRTEWERRFESNEFQGEKERCKPTGIQTYMKFWREPKEVRAKSGTKPQLCARGVAILQADRETPAKMITRVVRTLQAADYPTIMFAVEQQDTK